MAILNNSIQQAAGSDNITLEQLNSGKFCAGLYKLAEPISIYKNKQDESIYCIGKETGYSLYKNYDNCSIIMCGDVNFDTSGINFFNSTTQIIIPYNDTTDACINEFFIRYNNMSGAWSTLTKFQSGESVRGVKTEQGFYLVDNSDPNHPVVLSDRTKMDKIVANYSFTGGSRYKPGEVIPTNASPDINAYVVAVDPDTGAITKIALVEEPLTTTEGAGANIKVNTAYEGSFVVFDKMGNLKESDLKAEYLKPYEFTFQDSYNYELTFDTKFDESDLAGGASDLGFGYAPHPFNNFNYIVINKDTGERVNGTVDYDYARAPYTSDTAPGSLVWYGIVDSSDKVLPLTEGLTGYSDGDTFEFELLGGRYHGTIVDTSQNPWKVTTDLANNAGSIVTGYVDTKTITGSGTGLKLYIRPTIEQPAESISLASIPPKSLVWSGIKAKTNTSMTKVGSIVIPFQFNFDMTIRGELTHFVEYNKINVTGYYGIHPKWLASNYNTITPNSVGAQDWNVGDKFEVTIKGNTYEGQILSTDSEPYTIHHNIPQTTDINMTGTYIAKPVAPSIGQGLSIDVNTVQSYTYKLDNIYVDPHGGYDPAFYANSQVDILLARQRVQAGTLDNIIAFSGVEGRFNELIRREIIPENSADRSHYAIPTEKAVIDYIEQKIDKDSIANLTDEWVQAGLKHNLNKSSGTVASSVLIPYADSSTDGLLKKEMFDKVNLMESKINSLSGLDSIAAQLGTKSQITQTKLNRAWSNSGKGTPAEGNKIINTSEGDNQGHNWMYLNMGGTIQWYDIGSGNVAVATNSIQGVVMGTPPTNHYEYYTSIVKQVGSAASFIGDTLTATATGATHFTVRVNNTDSEGNIVNYTLSPDSGTDSVMLANIPFTKAKTTPLYYITSYTFDTSAATGYVTRENFSIDGLSYVGAVINATVNPMLAVANIPTKSNTDISGTYNTTSTNGTGTGLKVIIKCEPYYESVTFRLNITSWENPVDTIEVSDLDGHMKASGMRTIADQVKFLYENKADKQEIDITSKDGTIAIKKPEGFEDYPRFDLSFNLATSTVWITLTPLLDGFTQQFDITTYLQGVSTSNLEFYYGDGILLPGIDYTLHNNVVILSPGAGYEKDQVVLLNNDTRGARITEVGSAGEILGATITTALPTPTDGSGADISAQFIYEHLKTPAMNSADSRTFMVKGVQLALISDLSGVTEVVDPTGTLNAGVQGNVATIGLNINNVFKANSSQPCYITLNTLVPGQGVLTKGSLFDLLQGLTNNVKWILDNGVWKYKTSANRVEIAIQDTAVTPKAGVDVLCIRPSDLGQIAPPLPTSGS